MKTQLLKPCEVDLLLRYPTGRSLRLARAGRIAHFVLPDGEIRFEEAEIKRILKPQAINAIRAERPSK
jgi:predicted site-specific integrase-resolvase